MLVLSERLHFLKRCVSPMKYAQTGLVRVLSGLQKPLGENSSGLIPTRVLSPFSILGFPSTLSLILYP